MEGNKKIESIEATQTPVDNGAKSLEQSNLEENKDLKLEVLELKKKLEESEKKREEEKEEAEKKLENKDLKLEIANKFSHMIAHDLKSPLSGFVSLLDFYEEGIKNNEIKNEELPKIISMVSKESKKVFNLLDNLSIFTYLRIKEIKPVMSELKLLEQVKDSIDPLLEIAKQKNINFNTSGINEKIEVLADSEMLQAVIRNLSSNAIKFTNIGGNIIIACEKVNDNIEISVTDDGIGLSEKEMDKLFEKIGKTRNGTNKETGTGFGLHFCKELIDEMGGTIRVESAEGHGAKFTVSLPAIESK